jgi:hypothetical protein
MSDPVSEPPATGAPRTLPAAPILSGRRGAAVIGFATGLIIFGLLVITGPFWAPAIGPLFTGGVQPAEQAVAERITQLEAARREDQQKTSQAAASMQKTAADIAATLQQLDRRIAVLESRPAAAAGDVAELRQELKSLESRPPASAGDMGEVRQQLEKLTAAGADLNRRIAALEKAEQAQSTADPTDTARLLAVLRIREAIEVGRPFSAEYEAVAALARSRPDIAAVAAALAEPAKSGVASRAVLGQRLHALAGTIATAEAPLADDDWGERAWARLRGLVTIRRIDGAGQSGPEAAVSAAERSLTAGDLGGAVAALDPLAGPAAETARPWLQMARQRLAVETALHQVEGLLVARLGVAK